MDANYIWETPTEIDLEIAKRIKSIRKEKDHTKRNYQIAQMSVMVLSKNLSRRGHFSEITD